jgi:hypothetical protein
MANRAMLYAMRQNEVACANSSHLCCRPMYQSRSESVGGEGNSNSPRPPELSLRLKPLPRTLKALPPSEQSICPRPAEDGSAREYQGDSGRACGIGPKSHDRDTNQDRVTGARYSAYVALTCESSRYTSILATIAGQASLPQNHPKVLTEVMPALASEAAITC